MGLLEAILGLRLLPGLIQARCGWLLRRGSLECLPTCLSLSSSTQARSLTSIPECSSGRRA